MDHKSLETEFWLPLVASGAANTIKNNFFSNDFLSSLVLTFTIAFHPVYLLINWRRSQDNLEQGLGVIYIFHVSVEKIILFGCMLHDGTVDISIYLSLHTAYTLKWVLRA